MDDPLLIALVGGAGAFAGALLGQLTQVMRDVASARRLARTRLEDIRRESYEEAMIRLLPLEAALGSTLLFLRVARPGQTGHAANTVWEDYWEKAAALAAEELPRIKQLLVKASDSVLASFLEISGNSMPWPGMIENAQVPIDPVDVDNVIASGNLSNLIHIALRDQTDIEIWESRISGIESYKVLVARLIHKMRVEAGLSKSRTPWYLTAWAPEQRRTERLRRWMRRVTRARIARLGASRNRRAGR